LLVATAAVGLFVAYTDAGRGSSHVFAVARHEIKVGAVLSPDDLILRPMSLPPSLEARAFDDLITLRGAIAVAPMAAGELVQSSAVVARRGGPGTAEISFPIDRHRIPPSTKNGERIDLVATYGSGTDAFSEVVARQAMVLSIERTAGGLGDGASVVLTVAVGKPADAWALVHAGEVAKVSALRVTAAVSDAEPTTPYRPTATPRPTSEPH